MLTLHQQPDKIERYRALAPVHDDPGLESLCVFDGAMIAEVLRSEAFAVVAYASHYEHISARTSLDFDAIIKTLNHIPLANEGERHRCLRGEMASAIGRRARESVPAMEAFTTELVRGVFRPDSDVDLVADLAVPLYDRLFSLWLGVEHGHLAEDLNFSQVFDRSMSLNRRKALNANIARLRAFFEALHAELPTSPEIAVAMNVIGSDALIGSIALSVWHVLTANPGLRLSDIRFPATLPSTGVPYIERIALEDVRLGDVTVAKGKRLRLFLDATTIETAGEGGDVSFGKGRHLCLGKPISLVVWRALSRAASALDLRFSPGEMRLRERDYVFNYPESAHVRFHD